MYDRKTSDWRGLSPLARGTPILEFVIWTPMRFIPAGAGNSSSAFLCAVSKSVYPRWRGELSCRVSNKRGIRGLSPLARGTPFCSLRALLTHRFIPAGAGNSSWIEPTNQPSPVYPRWRGELCRSPRAGGNGFGLSPLARGTLKNTREQNFHLRFIPAGAGNSLNITYY